VIELYGDRIPRQELKRVWDDDVFMKHGIFMTQEIQALAEAILLHSDYQAKILKAEGAAGAPSPSIVPLGVPTPPSFNGSRRSEGPGPLIVSYGIASVPVKRLDLLVEAFALLAEEHPAARLKIVGQAAAGDRKTISSLAEQPGISGKVELRGRADEREYWEILRSADLAVQLRTGMQGGEASAAVCDCIAARVSTIVSDIGWFAELPRDVVSPIGEHCEARELATEMASILDDERRRASIEAAQDRYAEETSFARVAERYVELLEL
jgi:glycosyltransferase involved in cell wall biosynthesis